MIRTMIKRPARDALVHSSLRWAMNPIAQMESRIQIALIAKAQRLAQAALKVTSEAAINFAGALVLQAIHAAVAFATVKRKSGSKKHSIATCVRRAVLVSLLAGSNRRARSIESCSTGGTQPRLDLHTDSRPRPTAHGLAQYHPEPDALPDLS